MGSGISFSELLYLLIYLFFFVKVQSKRGRIFPDLGLGEAIIYYYCLNMRGTHLAEEL